MKCLKCGVNISDDSRFCDHCGAHVDVGRLPYGFHHGPHRKKTLKILGSDPSCDIVLQHETISRRHASLEHSPAGIRIADLGSSNGTFVNGGQIGSQFVALRKGDQVRLGLCQVDPFSIQSSPEHQPDRVISVSRNHLILGRSDDCDIVVNHPLVSARHARARRNAEGFLIEDLGSRNGTFLNGNRVKGTQQMRPNDRLSLASVPVQLDAGSGQLAAAKLRGSIQLDVEGLCRSIVTDAGAKKQLLSEMSFSIGPAELVGVMGPSGAGKSTLLMSLSGSERPSAGSVKINGSDLHLNFESFRHLIGFVPQDDVLHPELTVREALWFSAVLRLPEDTSELEIQQRVEKLLKDLKLEEIADLRIGSAADKTISGGQRKRVNLGIELVGDPELIFLDEPTSGLSSQDAVEVVSVLKEFASAGRTLILTIHQPSAEIFNSLSQVIFLSKGGRLAYIGSTGSEVFDFFGTESLTPESLMKALEGKNGEVWEAQFRRTSHGYLAPPSASAAPASHASEDRFARKKSRPDVSMGRQTLHLLHRYAITKVRDKSNLIFLVLQAPVVGLMLALLFGEGRTDFLERDIPIFISGIAVLFFGAFNACREIVRERVIHQRERLIFLRSLPYLLSKLILLFGIALAQSFVLLLIVKFFIGLQGNFFEYLAVFAATSLSAIALGLLISSVVRSIEAAMTIVPIIIILHIVLAGFLKPLDLQNQEHVGTLAVPFVSRWSTEALMEVERRGLSAVKSGHKSPANREGLCEWVGESPEAMQWCLLRAQVPKGYRPHRLGRDFLVLLTLCFTFLGLANASLRLRK